MKKVLFLGLGYIGLPTAAVAATHGYQVIGVDVNPVVVDTINQGRIHIVEPDLAKVVKEAVCNGALRATTKPEQADAFFVVPTPFKQNHRADITYVESATRSVIPFLKEGDLFVIESTSPVFTTERMAEVIYKERPELKDKLYIAYCPERVLPGNTLYELVHNDRVIGGINPESTGKAIEFYSAFVKGTLHRTNARTAEMCKLTENTFRDINIAYANELSKVCDRLGIDVFKLIELANCHPRVNVHTPGVGVGGHCIAVDPWFIHEKFEDITPLICQARLVNDGKPAWVAERVARDVKPGQKVAVLGMSFKANIDDTRESPSVLFANLLRDKGYEIVACEPYICGMVAGYENHSLEEAMALCDYAVITLQHDLFKKNRALIASKPYYDCVGLMEK